MANLDQSCKQVLPSDDNDDPEEHAVHDDSDLEMVSVLERRPRMKAQMQERSQVSVFARFYFMMTRCRYTEHDMGSCKSKV